MLDLALKNSMGPVIVPMTVGESRYLCLERLQEPEFAEQVWADHLTIAHVADHIADAAGQQSRVLQPSTRPVARASETELVRDRGRDALV